MKLVTRIVENSNNSVEIKLLRTINNILYPAINNQVMKFNCEGENITCIVKGTEDSIYEDIVYRYIEVSIIK